MTSVHWGILSTALLGTAKLIPTMRKSALPSVAAIASSSRLGAEAVAAELGVAKACGA